MNYMQNSLIHDLKHIQEAQQYNADNLKQFIDQLEQVDEKEFGPHSNIQSNVTHLLMGCLNTSNIVSYIGSAIRQAGRLEKQ